MELTQTLERAAPVYKARWWPEHNRANLAWIAAVTPLVAKYEGVMKKELSTAYQTQWPPGQVRTDVSEYANWAGAYTLLDPTLITISSHDLVTQAAVESLFHEASHAMIQKISDALAAELDSQKKLFRRRAFWHAVLFYTAGETAQRHLDDYMMFGIQNGVFDRAWPGALPVLEKTGSHIWTARSILPPSCTGWWRITAFLSRASAGFAGHQSLAAFVEIRALTAADDQRLHPANPVE